MERYLEDLTVGQRFAHGEALLDAAAIKAFGAAFDPQPFHLDEAAAEASFFGGLAASGWHTAALTMRLLVEGGAPFAGGIIGAGGEIAWPRAVRPGDRLRIETEIKAISPSRSRPDRGMVTLACTTFNQKDEVVQQASFRLLAFRRPDQAAAPKTR